MRRLRLLLTGAPDTGLCDILADAAPALWDADGLEVDFFLCDLEDRDEEFDLDSIVSLTLEIRTAPDAEALLAGPVSPDDDLEECDRDDFDDDDGEHGTFTLTGAQLNFVASRKKVWLSIRATLTSGGPVTFGAGYVKIAHSGHGDSEDPAEGENGGFLYITSDTPDGDGLFTVTFRGKTGRIQLFDIADA